MYLDAQSFQLEKLEKIVKKHEKKSKNSLTHANTCNIIIQCDAVGLYRLLLTILQIAIAGTLEDTHYPCPGE